ncbi:MAG: hypothetical protein IPJ74_20950 [Saprospiraceae bacterium]|nr:hypothetical protein [Saprospiraceae bacterium]
MGTKWNGSPKYGIGAEINIDKSFSLLFGAGVHISNGDTKGQSAIPA